MAWWVVKLEMTSSGAGRRKQTHQTKGRSRFKAKQSRHPKHSNTAANSIPVASEDISLSVSSLVCLECSFSVSDLISLSMLFASIPSYKIFISVHCPFSLFYLPQMILFTYICLNCGKMPPTKILGPFSGVQFCGICIFTLLCSHCHYLQSFFIFPN